MICVIMMGCPGSGKTFKAKEYEAKGFIRISQDDQGRKAHKIEFDKAIEAKKDIVVDRMNFSIEQRERYAIPAKKAGYTVIYHQIIADEEVCIERCVSRQDHPTITDEEIARKAIDFFTDFWENVDFNKESFDEFIIEGN